MTNDEITIAMAEVEGWKGPQHPYTQAHIATWPHSRGKSIWWMDPNGTPKMLSSVPSYLRDANACLRVLENEGSFHVDRTHLADDGEEYRVSLRSREAIGYGSTFCRAACEAVLRAHGKWRE